MLVGGTRPELGARNATISAISPTRRSTASTTRSWKNAGWCEVPARAPCSATSRRRWRSGRAGRELLEPVHPGQRRRVTRGACAPRRSTRSSTANAALGGRPRPGPARRRCCGPATRPVAGSQNALRARGATARSRSFVVGDETEVVLAAPQPQTTRYTAGCTGPSRRSTRRNMRQPDQYARLAGPLGSGSGSWQSTRRTCDNRIPRCGACNDLRHCYCRQRVGSALSPLRESPNSRARETARVRCVLDRNPRAFAERSPSPTPRPSARGPRAPPRWRPRRARSGPRASGGATAGRRPSPPPRRRRGAAPSPRAASHLLPSWRRREPRPGAGTRRALRAVRPVPPPPAAPRAGPPAPRRVDRRPARRPRPARSTWSTSWWSRTPPSSSASSAPSRPSPAAGPRADRGRGRLAPRRRADRERRVDPLRRRAARLRREDRRRPHRGGRRAQIERYSLE